MPRSGRRQAEERRAPSKLRMAETHGHEPKTTSLHHTTPLPPPHTPATLRPDARAVSMSGRFPSSPSQDSSHTGNPTGARSTRLQHSPWQGSSNRQPTRRGLPPISTASGIPSRGPGNTSSPSRAVFSPTRQDLNPSAPAANRQVTSRHSSTSSTHSFGISAVAAQHQHHVSGSIYSGSRARPGISSTGSPRLTSPITGVPSASQSTFGVSGGGSARFTRQSPSLSLSTTSSPVSSSGPHSATASSGQLTSLVITQLNILLSTIKEDGDSAKWQAQADKIHRLVEENGMEVFSQYFRRLLQSNAGAIFGSNGRQPTDNGNYQLLAQEMQKISQDRPQASKIAEALVTGDGDLFRDFDIAALADHFRLDALAKMALVTACRDPSKRELWSRGRLSSH